MTALTVAEANVGPRAVGTSAAAAGGTA